MLKKINNIMITGFLLLLLLTGFFPASAATSQNTVLDQEKLNYAIGKYIEKNMPWPAGSMRYEIMTRLPQIAGSEDRFTWKIDSRRDENYIGETYLILKHYSNGVLLREENIRTRIEVLRDFVVSVRNLIKDEIIATDDIMLKKKWVRSVPANAISGTEQVIGKAASHNIRQNTELTVNMFKEAVAVRRGKMVQILLSNGPMNITATGLSEEDGAEGSFVKVRNVSSNKVIYARVIGEAKVRVDF